LAGLFDRNSAERIDHDAPRRPLGPPPGLVFDLPLDGCRPVAALMCRHALHLTARFSLGQASQALPFGRDIGRYTRVLVLAFIEFDGLPIEVGGPPIKHLTALVESSDELVQFLGSPIEVNDPATKIGLGHIEIGPALDELLLVGGQPRPIPVEGLGPAIKEEGRHTSNEDEGTRCQH
jgi:hypothetical protein